MLVKYSNFITFDSFTNDFLELVDLIDEKGYKPSTDAGHDVHKEIERLQNSQKNKFDKDKVFKMTFFTDSKSYNFTGITLERKECFNDVAMQETNRDMKYIKDNL